VINNNNKFIFTAPSPWASLVKELDQSRQL